MEELSFIGGLVSGYSIVLMFYLIYCFYKWVKKVNDNLSKHQCDLNQKDYFIDNLKARVKKLEDCVNNMSRNEETEA